MVKIQILKLLKNVKCIKQNVHCNSYYLNCKHLLHKFIFVFRDMSVCLLWLFISTWINFFNPFNICILILLLYIYDVTSYYCIFLCLIPTRRLLKKAKPCRRFTTCLYITASNQSAVVGICMVLSALKSMITQTWKYSMHEGN